MLHSYSIGLTENDGHENDGPSKLQGVKLQDIKLQDRKLQDMKMPDMKMQDMKMTDKNDGRARSCRVLTEIALQWSVHCANFMSCYFMSCIFTSCHLVRHFHVQHFQRPPFTNGWRHSCLNSHFRTSSSDITNCYRGLRNDYSYFKHVKKYLIDWLISM